jgi:hypothetical protein
MIDLVEFQNGFKKYPNLQVRLDQVLVDGTAVPFDANKILYGDLEGNGNYRIELFNTYGSTGSSLPTSNPWSSYSEVSSGKAIPALGFSSSIEVKYTVLKLF